MYPGIKFWFDYRYKLAPEPTARMVTAAVAYILYDLTYYVENNSLFTKVN